MINFDQSVNSLIVHKAVNKLSELNKIANTEVAAYHCSVAVLKNQKQPLSDVLRSKCS